MRKMGKRLLSAALAACLCLGLMAVPASAEESESITQTFELTTSATGRDDALYDVKYKAKLTVEEPLAKALAVNCTETGKLEKLRFTCTLTDGLVAQLDSVSESDFTFDGGDYFTLEFVSMATNESGEKTGVQIVYKLNEDKINTWKNQDVQTVKDDIYNKEWTMTAKRTANNSQISTAMDKSTHKIITSGAVVLSMSDEQDIPFFKEKTLTLAQTAETEMTIKHSVTFMNVSNGYFTGTTGTPITAPAFTGSDSENFDGWTNPAANDNTTLAAGTTYQIGYENVIFYPTFKGQIDFTIDGLQAGQTATVSLQEAEEQVGNKVTKTMTAEETSWSDKFSDVPYGIYNLVVKVFDKDAEDGAPPSVTVTKSVELNSGSADVTVTLPPQRVSTVVTGDVHAAPEALESAISDQDKETIFNGNNSANITITITLNAAKVTEPGDGTEIQSTDPKDDLTEGKKKVDSLAGTNNHDLTDYVDVTVAQQVTVDGKPEAPVYLSTTADYQTIYFRVSAELYQKLAEVGGSPRKNIVVYRDHDDHNNHQKTEQLTKVSASVGPGAKAECYFIQEVEGNYYIGIRTDTFSLYAFGVSPTEVPESDLSSGSGSGSGSGSSPRYEISVAAADHGTVTADRTSASAGTKVTLTVAPDSGYRLASLTVTDRNGKTVAVTANSDGTWSFTMPSGKVTVTPAWRIAVADPDETGLSLLLNTDDHTAFMIGGDTGGFLPEDDMTRAQAAMVFYRLLRDRDLEAVSTFDDVPESAWYAQAVNTLAALGIVEGYAQGLYGPDRSITRAEFATIAARFAHASTDSMTVFSDVSETDWSYPYITTAAAYGWIVGSDGAFFPTRCITRVEAATIVNRMLGRLCDEDAVDAGAGTRFPDVPETHWGFYQVVEATTTHDYVMNGDRSKETWTEKE